MTSTTTDPTVSKLERGYCQTCGLDVALRKGGLAREHTNAGAKCPGSGLPASADKPTPMALAEAQAAPEAGTVEAAADTGADFVDLVANGGDPVIAAALNDADQAPTAKARAGRSMPASPAPSPGAAPRFATVALTLFDEAPDNVRVDFGDPQELQELGASIAKLGLVEPIVGRYTDDGRVEVIAGARRLRAARLNGTTTELDVILRDGIGDAERIELMLVENALRKDLVPLEEAAAFARLTNEFGYTQARLAERLGRSQSHISKRLSLLKLPAKIRDRVASGAVPVDAAVELAKLPAAVADAALDAAERYSKTPDTLARELPGAITRAKAEHERDAKLKAARKTLTATGVRVIDWAQPWKLPEGVVKLEEVGPFVDTVDAELGAGWDDKLEHAKALLVLADKHAACPGHAAAVDPNGVVEYYCTNAPELHPEPAARDADAPARSTADRQNAEREARYKILDDAQAARMVAMRAVLDSRLPRDVVADFVAWSLIDQHGILEPPYTTGEGDLSAAQTKAAELLGVLDHAVDGVAWEFVAGVAIEAHGSPHVAMACALAHGDEELADRNLREQFGDGALDTDSDGPVTGYRPPAARLLDLLVARGGYTLAEHEQARLDAGDTEAANEGRVACALCHRAHYDGVSAARAAGLADGEADAILATTCAPIAAAAGVQLTITDAPPAKVTDAGSVDDWEDPDPAGTVDVDAAATAVARAAAATDEAAPVG